MTETPGARSAAANPRGGSAAHALLGGAAHLRRAAWPARRAATSRRVRSMIGVSAFTPARSGGASRWVAATKRSSAAAAAPESTACCAAADPLGEGRRPAAGVDRRAGVEHGQVARRAGRAPRRRCAGRCRRSAPDRHRGPTPRAAHRQPDVLGRHVVARDLAVDDLDDAGGRRDAQLVQAVVAGDQQRVLGAQQRQRARHLLQVGGVRDADQLPRGARRVGERAEEVEDRADRQLAPDRDDVARGLVVGGREHEAEADLLDAPGHRRPASGRCAPPAPRARRPSPTGRWPSGCRAWPPCSPRRRRSAPRWSRR